METFARAVRLGGASVAARDLRMSPAATSIDGLLRVSAPATFGVRHVAPLRPDNLSTHNCLGYTMTGQTGTSMWSFGSSGGHKVPLRGTVHYAPDASPGSQTRAWIDLHARQLPGLAEGW
jgi:hypothetical protein